MSNELKKRSLEGLLSRTTTKLRAAQSLLRRFEERNGTVDCVAHNNLVATVEEYEEEIWAINEDLKEL